MISEENTVENPNTAILSESETEQTLSKPSTPVRRRRRRKHDKKFRPNFDIPGVFKIVLSEMSQRSIGCVAGDTVTAEKPWLNIDKDLVTEDIDNFAEKSEFFPLKNEIAEFTGSEFLFGYIPDDSKDYDEFYICVTEEAIEKVNEIIEKLRKIQEERLQNAIHRQVKPWTPLGSDKEVEECKLKVNRSLIEVEIESKYPILPFKIQFKLVKTEDLRDGYMELIPTDESLSTIFRRRIDAFIQVAPSVINSEAQTVCSYPKNSYTQYEYEIPQEALPSPECVKLIEDYIGKNIDNFCDILKVNGCIDLYVNDYDNLVLNPKFATKIAIPSAKDYLSFIDMNLCGKKMISSMAWHPMWTGCILTSYVDIAPVMYIDHRITTDEVHKAVHDNNIVLFWSFCDDLKPKLILETPRPVYAVNFCPYDENLVIGGCVNGQIIIWDITNKLSRVEEEEILTLDQQSYRRYMHSLMNWMKNIFDLALIRPTAISDLKYSHKGCVNAINWMSPFHSISKTGKISELLEDAPRSLQLITSAEDGTIMIWDLLKKPVVAPGGFKAIRKMRRLKKRPSALLTEESPFKILHLNLKPVYKINMAHTMDNHRMISISAFTTNFFNTEYKLEQEKKMPKLSERLIYQPVLHSYNANPRLTFHLGTMEGDYIQGMWEGQAFDSGEVVNWEEAQFVNYSKIHDGPIVSVDYSPSHHTILTVGGKIFAMWREDFLGRPILWRKTSAIYTNGSWFLFDKSSIKVVRIDGYFEIWTMFYKSKGPVELRLTSNGAVTSATTHPRDIKYSVVGLCDYRGLFRLFYRKRQSPLVLESKSENMSSFLTSEVKRKKDFLRWQEEFNKRYASKLEVAVNEEEQSLAPEGAEAKRLAEKKKVVQLSPGQRYLETVQEQHKVHEQERIKNIILKKKQMDTEELMKRSEPLRKLEEENEVKKRKQRNKLKESDKIFKDTVAMLFPDVVKEKPPPPPDPYEDCYDDDVKERAFRLFNQISIEAQDYVEENPFKIEFSWANTIKTGRERRKRLDDSAKTGLPKRYSLYKEEKAKKLLEEAEAEAEAKKSLPMVRSKSSRIKSISSAEPVVDIESVPEQEETENVETSEEQ